MKSLQLHALCPRLIAFETIPNSALDEAKADSNGIQGKKNHFKLDRINEDILLNGCKGKKMAFYPLGTKDEMHHNEATPGHSVCV